MGHLPDTRYSLLARLAEPDDRGAWAEFLETYEGVVLRYCRGRGLQDADARDVMQEVLVAVHNAMSDWRPSGRPGSFRAWLVQTAHRQCLKKLRSQATQVRGTGGTSMHTRLDVLVATDEHASQDANEWQRWAFCWAAELVRREVQPVTWQAFWLTAVDGQAPSDVARRCDMRIGSVYAAKCRVLSRIRERIQELSRNEP